MASKTVKTRLVQKHDTKINWDSATNFAPKQGEIIIEDAGVGQASRIKVGDGTTKAPALPYASVGFADKAATVTEVIGIDLGGTGATTADQARNNLGIGDSGTYTADHYALKSHNHKYAGAKSAGGPASKVTTTQSTTAANINFPIYYAGINTAGNAADYQQIAYSDTFTYNFKDKTLNLSDIGKLNAAEMQFPKSSTTQLSAKINVDGGSTLKLNTAERALRILNISDTNDTTGQLYNFPNKSGTVALIDDIPEPSQSQVINHTYAASTSAAGQTCDLAATPGIHMIKKEVCKNTTKDTDHFTINLPDYPSEAYISIHGGNGGGILELLTGSIPRFDISTNSQKTTSFLYNVSQNKKTVLYLKKIDGTIYVQIIRNNK